MPVPASIKEIAGNQKQRILIFPICYKPIKQKDYSKKYTKSYCVKKHILIIKRVKLLRIYVLTHGKTSLLALHVETGNLM